MKDHLLPAVEGLGELTTEQLLRLWAEVTDASDQLLLAGIRREAGTEDEAIAAYRRWYSDQVNEHDRALVRMLGRLGQAEANRDR